MKRNSATSPHGANTPASARNRVDLVDAARGIAITMTIAHHFCFDLTSYRWTD